MISGPTAGAMVQVDEVLQLGARPAGDEDDLRARLARTGQAAAHERRHAAGRHADDDVLLAGRSRPMLARPFLVVVLDAFLAP